MVLVFFIFLIIILGIVFSMIEINVKEIMFSNHEKKIHIEIYLFFFQFIKILSLKINSENLIIFKKKVSLEKLKKKVAKRLDITKLEKKVFRRTNLSFLKLLKLDIKRLIIYFEFSTNHIFLTTYATPFISTLLSLLYSKVKYDSKNFYFKINPMYLHKKYFYVEAESIIRVKMVHIINMMYQLLRKGVKEK